MASPQESITTVNGRRCTRSRARTAAASIFSSPQPPAVTTSQQAAASAPVQIAPNILTSAAAQVDPPAQAPPSSQAPPPAQAPPPSSNVPAERPAAAPTTPVAAVSSAIGTSRAVSIPSTRPSLLANIAPSPPAPAAPVAPVVSEAPVASAAPAAPAAPVAPEAPLEASTTPAAIVAVSQVLGRSSSAILEIATSIRSDTIPAGAPSALPAESSLPAPVFASQVESALLISTSAAAPEQPNQTATSPNPSSANIPLAEAPGPTTTAVTTLPSGDSSAGIIAPGQGPNSDESGLTIPANGNPNIGSIVGGVVGGVAGLALVCALLFFCLRKRKTSEPRWLEKPSDGPTFIEKIKAIPSGITAAVAKMKGGKQGPGRSSYRRHAPQDSISSVYSNDGRSRSMSEPQGFYAGGARPSSRSSRVSRKGDRNVLRKKNSSVSSQSTFTGIMAELDRDPFVDPEPPRTLLLLNPDINQSPRGPVTPQPAATSAAMTTNPFSSPFDDENTIDPYMARPPPLGHRRTGSSASALSSNPPEFFTPAPLNTKDIIGPPPPTQAALPSQNRRSSMAFPAFNATSTIDSRESFYGEPGPSRPGTNLFTPGLPTGRTVRQSDPFDLDRPEVLGFGAVGRREVRASVTRQGTINRRMSSAGNWATTTADSQGTQRDSAVPRPLWSASVRR